MDHDDVDGKMNRYRSCLSHNIGVGRFRILGGGGEGGQGLEYLGAKGGQIPSRHMTS